MNTLTSKKYDAIDEHTAATAFKVANNILDAWKCTSAQKEALLGMKKSAFYNKLHLAMDKKPIKLDRDQFDRVSFILNIHQALKLVFSNKENVFGFVHMPNNNPFFNGKTPMQMMETGSLANLYEVYCRIDLLRGAGW
jgi:hypothetical protein